MKNNQKEKRNRVIKANDALMRAKEEFKERDEPIPDAVRKELRDAIADYEKSNGQ